MKTLLVAGVLALASLAHADFPPDRVTLKDGSVLQGRLAELKPDETLTLVLLTGESRSFDWSELAQVSGPSFAGQPSVAALMTPDPVVEMQRQLELQKQLMMQRQLAALATLSRPDRLVHPSLTNPRGRMLTLMGPIALVLGTVYVAVGATERDPMMRDLHDAFIGVGSVALAAGVSTLIAGIVLLSHKDKTQKVADLTRLQFHF